MDFKVSVYTLGCKVNQYESRAIYEALSDYGVRFANKGETADICIINTCTVTSESDRKSRQTVRKAISENKGALVIVTGCSSQIDPKSFYKIEGVNAVVSNASKMDVCKIVWEFIKTGKRDFSDYKNDQSIETASFEKMSIKSSERTRAYVKIEDGCESKCAYCIIPKARGKIRSKPRDEALKEVKTLVESE
jgi:threonylcarbamoyladenosine tRNA methylthiotransferase MtaB